MPDFDKDNNSAALDPENKGSAGLPLVAVWDPYGEKHIVRKDNANDLCNIGTMIKGKLVQWSLTDPNAHRPPLTVDGAPMTAGLTMAPTDNQKLQALRDAAELMGIPVDARWGLKRLTEELGKMKALPKTAAEIDATPKIEDNEGVGV